MTDKPDPAAARALCDNFTKLEAAIKEQKARATGAETLYEAVREWENLDSLRREAAPALISHVRALADEVERLNGEINRRKGDPVTRLHNLCEGLEDVEPYGLEEWNRIDAENSELRERAERAEAERDALLLVARAAYKKEDAETADENIAAQSTILDAFHALPAALLAKVKGGEG